MGSPGQLVAPLAVVAALAAGAGCASPDDAPWFTAQRSSFATDGATAADGHLELELGGDLGAGDERGSFLQLNYGLDPVSEVYVGGAPYLSVRADDGGARLRGHGDVQVGYRRQVVVRDAERLGFAWQAAACLPTASDDALGTGEYDLFLAGIVDGGSPALAWTVFYQLGNVGDPDDSSRRTQHALSLVAGRALRRDLHLFAEVFGVRTPARDEHTASAQLGLAWTARPHLVWYLVLQTGLDDDAPDTRVLFGFAVDLGRPGGARAAASPRR